MSPVPGIQPAEWAPPASHEKVIALRDFFCRVPFDFAFTAYPTPETYQYLGHASRYGTTMAERVLAYTRERLAEAKYRGHYVIAVHDKFGSTLWHPHMMLDGRGGQMEKVKQAFHPVADINCKKNGPIRNLRKWGFYCAARACDYGLNSMHFEMDFMGPHKKKRRRGSRGRGGGSPIPVTIEQKEQQYV